MSEDIEWRDVRRLTRRYQRIKINGNVCWKIYPKNVKRRNIEGLTWKGVKSEEN